MKPFVFAMFGASAVYGQSAIYEQCGGSLWTGSTSCVSGTTCQMQNSYYSQCLPGPGGASDGSSGGQSAAPSMSGSNSGDPKSDGSGANLGAAASSAPAAAATSPALPAAASSQPATQGGAQGGSMKPSSSTGSNTGSSPGGGNPGGNSTAQPASGGACSAYTGDKTGVASTTHYDDGQKGACGCGSGSGMAQWQSGAGVSNIFTAAGSPNLFGGSSTWCGSGCGQCYELKNLGALPAANMGDCTGSGETITVMITNLCPTNGNEQWCSVPDAYGFPAHFDIMSQGGPNGWNNPVVSYKQITCPGSLTSDYASCQCASGQTSRARRGLFGETSFGY